MVIAISIYTLPAAVPMCVIITSYRGPAIFRFNLNSRQFSDGHVFNLNVAVTCTSALTYMNAQSLLLSSAGVASDNMADRGQLLVC